MGRESQVWQQHYFPALVLRALERVTSQGKSILRHLYLTVFNWVYDTAVFQASSALVVKVSNERSLLPPMEKETATHSSVLAWIILGTEEPGGLPSTGSHRVGHDWSDLAAAAATPNSWNPKPNSVPELILTVSQNKQLSARTHPHTHTHTYRAG